jgi:hypothetical protein
LLGAMDDTVFMSQADDHLAEQRYFKAAACLKSVHDKSLLQPKHHRILEMATKAAAVRDVLLLPHPETEGWRKQGESHGQRDTLVFYKVNKDNTLVSRVESLIESSLLCPLLSILNETDLFHTWMPKWRVPRLGVTESICLKEMGRGHQIVRVRVDMPFPLDNRECIQHAFAVDSIDEDNAIIIKINTLDTGVHYEIDIPEVDKGYRRVDFDAGILIRPCPMDHPALERSKHRYPDDEKLLLVSLMQQIDAHVAYVPLKLINFFSRTVIGQMWGTLLQIADDVKQGKRPEHQASIAAKQDLYGWIEKRVDVMLSVDGEKVASENGELEVQAPM